MSERFLSIERSSPRLDAQLLLCHVLHISRVELYTQLDRPLVPHERDALRALVRRRMQGEPVAYILNKKEWHTFSLYVDERVLIPRPETETLFDLCSAWLRLETFGTLDGESDLCVVDLCTGSGCLAFAFAKAYPSAKVVGIDLSEGALAVARMNAERLGLGQIEFIHADVGAASVWQRILQLSSDFQNTLVISNPPYVSHEEWLNCDIEVRHFEPKQALVADEGGLALARSIKTNWNRLAELLNAAELQSAAKRLLLAVETGESHPQQLANTAGVDAGQSFLPVFTAQTQSREYPFNTDFACEDLEGKVRFLFSSCGTKAH